MEFKENFKGEEFWRKLNFLIIFIIYAFLFIMMAFPKQSLSILTGLGFFIVGYVAFQQYYFREMDKKNRGKTVIAGWITHTYGVGEEYEFPKVRITPIEKLSATDKASVDKFINYLVMKAKEKRGEIMPDMSNISSITPKLENKITNEKEGEIIDE